jgi:hypothetical protein
VWTTDSFVAFLFSPIGEKPPVSFNHSAAGRVGAVPQTRGYADADTKARVAVDVAVAVAVGIGVNVAVALGVGVNVAVGVGVNVAAGVAVGVGVGTSQSAKEAPSNVPPGMLSKKEVT